MPKEDDKPRRKRRTSEHVCADLSVNYVEELVLRCGFTLQRVSFDYGYDVEITTFNERGEIENGTIRAQLKANTNFNKSTFALKERAVFSFPIERKDYELWSNELFPVLLVLYDVTMREAFWIDVRELALTNPPKFRLDADSVRIHVPRTNVLGCQTFIELRRQTQELVQQYASATVKS